MSKHLESIDLIDEIPAGRRTDPFLNVVTLKLRNRYTDGTSSREYFCDVLIPRWIDAVAVALFYRDGGTIMVLLRECLRPALWIRRRLSLPEFDPERSATTLEIVAGRLEPGDTGRAGIAFRAAEEALQEAGYHVEPAKVILLGAPYFASPGITPERIYLAAAEIDPAETRPITGDGSPMEEVGSLRFVALDDAVSMCRTGAVEDGKTEIALLRLREWLASSSPRGK